MPEKDRFLFARVVDECFEPLEKYHPGGFHPVHLNDLFKDGRYKVIRKLGAGADAMVWLANDLM
jgi:non-specific serine/threonine protein kinase